MAASMAASESPPASSPPIPPIPPIIPIIAAIMSSSEPPAPPAPPPPPIMAENISSMPSGSSSLSNSANIACFIISSSPSASPPKSFMTFSICSLTCGSTSSESPIASLTEPAIIAFISSGGGAGMPDILHIILNWAYMTSYMRSISFLKSSSLIPVSSAT